MIPLNLRVATIVIGVISACAIFVAHLALTDIYHAEADLTLEWRVLQVCFLIIIAFHVLAMMTVWKNRSI